MTTLRSRRSKRVAEVIEEYKQLILARFPDAEFEVTKGDDPPGIHVWATVDAEDLFEVSEYVAPYVVDVQVDEGLPIYLIPTRDRPLRARLAEAEKRDKEASAEIRNATGGD
jgi:hypothetical protein